MYCIIREVDSKKKKQLSELKIIALFERNGEISREERSSEKEEAR